MSWLLGYGRPDLRYGVAAQGVVTANGIPVTESEGRIHVPLPPAAVRAGAPGEITVALRITHDVLGAAVLHANEITIGPRRVTNVAALFGSGDASWVAHLGAAVHAAVAHQLALAEHKGHTPSDANGTPAAR